MVPWPKQSAARLCRIGSGCVVLQLRGRDIQARHRRPDEYGGRARDASALLARRDSLISRRVGSFRARAITSIAINWRNDFACANQAAKRMRPVPFVVKPQEESDEYR
jgi:hypothetical protein